MQRPFTDVYLYFEGGKKHKRRDRKSCQRASRARRKRVKRELRSSFSLIGW